MPAMTALLMVVAWGMSEAHKSVHLIKTSQSSDRCFFSKDSSNESLIWALVPSFLVLFSTALYRLLIYISFVSMFYKFAKTDHDGRLILVKSLPKWALIISRTPINTQKNLSISLVVSWQINCLLISIFNGAQFQFIQLIWY